MSPTDHEALGKLKQPEVFSIHKDDTLFSERCSMNDLFLFILEER